MNKSQIQKTIAGLETRLADLSEQRDAAEAALRDARRGLVDGSASGVSGDLIERQTAAQAIREAVAEVEADLVARRAELQAMTEEESRAAEVAEREAKFERIRDLAERAHRARQEHDEAFLAACRALEEHIATMKNALFAWWEAHEEFVSAADDFTPGLRTTKYPPYGVSDDEWCNRYRPFLDEVQERGIDLHIFFSERLTTTLVDWTPHIKLFVGRRYDLPNGPFAGPVELAFQHSIGRRR